MFHWEDTLTIGTCSTAWCALQLFCDAKRAEIKAANPAAGFGETGKLLAAAWKECSADDKASFQEQSQVRQPPSTFGSVQGRCKRSWVSAESVGSVPSQRTHARASY